MLRKTALGIIFAALFCLITIFANSVSLLNASYDPTRELYNDFNSAFVKRWKAKTGQTLTIHQSHGASQRWSYPRGYSYIGARL